MQASVRVRVGDHVETLMVGDLVGRAWTAALRIDDPRVSEAHALLSLRGESLWLLALRRRMLVGNRSVEAVELVPGLEVRFTPDHSVVVESVQLPETVLGLEGPGLPRQVLPGTCALQFDPHPRLAPGSLAGAAAWFWRTDESWRFRLGTGAARTLSPGDTFAVDGFTYRAVRIPIATAGQSHTRAGDGPIRLVATWDTVHIHRADGEVVVLAGQMARLVAELVSVRQPLPWEDLARPHWPDAEDRDALRRRWDRLLARIRERLRAGGIRPDLVSSTRIGLVELVLHQGDVVEDRS